MTGTLLQATDDEQSPQLTLVDESAHATTKVGSPRQMLPCRFHLVLAYVT